MKIEGQEVFDKLQRVSQSFIQMRVESLGADLIVCSQEPDKYAGKGRIREGDVSVTFWKTSPEGSRKTLGESFIPGKSRRLKKPSDSDECEPWGIGPVFQADRPMTQKAAPSHERTEGCGGPIWMIDSTTGSDTGIEVRCRRCNRNISIHAAVYGSLRGELGRVDYYCKETCSDGVVDLDDQDSSTYGM